MKKILLMVGLVAVLLVALGSIAYAYTPAELWAYYQQNGALPDDVTDAELQAFLDDATMQQYAPNDTQLQELNRVIQTRLGSREQFPFTGTQIVLLAFGVVALLGTGLGLRRLARNRS